MQIVNADCMIVFTDAMSRFHFQVYSFLYVHRPITYELKIKLIKMW